jgi:hypothetical protein
MADCSPRQNPPGWAAFSASRGIWRGPMLTRFAGYRLRRQILFSFQSRFSFETSHQHRHEHLTNMGHAFLIAMQGRSTRRPAIAGDHFTQTRRVARRPNV